MLNRDTDAVRQRTKMDGDRADGVLPALFSTADPVLHRVAVGEASAMGECIRIYGALVWGLSCRFWRSASRFDATKGSERMFIAIIARRRSIDRLRKSYNEPTMDTLDVLQDSPSGTAPELTAEVSVDAEQALAVLSTLRAEYRQVLELSLQHELTHTQIAAQLDLPLGTVKSFLRRGLMQLRDLLSPKATGAIAHHARQSVAKRCRSRLSLVTRPTGIAALAPA